MSGSWAFVAGYNAIRGCGSNEHRLRLGPMWGIFDLSSPASPQWCTANITGRVDWITGWICPEDVARAGMGDPASWGPSALGALPLHLQHSERRNASHIRLTSTDCPIIATSILPGARYVRENSRAANEQGVFASRLLSSSRNELSIARHDGRECAPLLDVYFSSLDAIPSYLFGTGNNGHDLSVVHVLEPEECPPPDLSIVDANNPNLVVSALDPPIFSDNYGRYGLRPNVDGLAADGSAHIAIVARSQHPTLVDFVITDPDNVAAPVQSLGVLRTTDGRNGVYQAGSWRLENIQTQPVGTEHVAVAILQAPTMLDPQLRIANELRIEALVEDVEDENPSELTFRVEPPPLLLVHGLWSSPETWQWLHFYSDRGLWVETIDYESTHDASFAENVRRLVPLFDEAIGRYRTERNSAAVQATVVGHSMGGLLGRMMIGGASPVPFFKEDNFFDGSIDRLVTLNSPHTGSPLADIAVDISEKLEFVAELLNHDDLRSWARALRPDAVQLLSPINEAILYMPDTRMSGVPVHAIVGRGDVECYCEAFDRGHGPIARYFRDLANVGSWLCGEEFKQDWTDTYFRGEANDMAVSECSQRSGLPIDAVTYIDCESALEAGSHLTVTRELRVAQRIYELATDGPFTSDDWADGFPNDSIGCALLPFAGGDSPLIDTQEWTLPLQAPLLSPHGRTVVSPGTTVHLTVGQADDFDPVQILIVGPGGILGNADEPGPVEFVVPDGYFRHLGCGCARSKRGRADNGLADAISHLGNRSPTACACRISSLRTDHAFRSSRQDRRPCVVRRPD